MIYGYSKLGNKYDKILVENNDAKYHEELKQMYRKKKCADCNSDNANWATLKRGVFVCVNCAQVLRADASNKVKSCLGTYLWYPDEMQKMRENYNN